MEVLHAIVRFVPSNPFQTFTQILSRLIVVWGILVPLVEARSTLGVPLILVAWGIAECTRYIYYALNIYGLNVYLITWLRYTLFIVLYPMGVSGEMLCMGGAIPIIASRKMWSIELPNIMNISFYYHYIVVIIMLSYIHCEYNFVAFIKIIINFISFRLQFFHNFIFTCSDNARRFFLLNQTDLSAPKTKIACASNSRNNYFQIYLSSLSILWEQRSQCRWQKQQQH